LYVQENEWQKTREQFVQANRGPNVERFSAQIEGHRGQ